MIREKERRERARERFAAYQAANGDSSSSSSSARKGTDYGAWDLWTPSDDEDDPWMSYTPNNPAFKAMEADIDKRHARQVERRQTAYRKREEGNALFKAGQHAEALKTYEAGLDADKRSVELHGNAAMAALKCACFVQCIEHCDKAIEICDFLLEDPKHATAIKCLQRRATARLALKHYIDAVKDLTKAKERDPGNKEIAKQLLTAEVMYDEARKEAEVERGMRRAGEGKAGEVDGTDFNTLRTLESLFKTVGAEIKEGDAGAPSASTAVDYAKLEKLLESSEACRVYARAGEGVGIAKLLREVAVVSMGKPGHLGRGLGPIRALRAACLSEQNVDALMNMDGLDIVVGFLTSSWNAGKREMSVMKDSQVAGGGAARKASCAAAFLLHTCSAEDAPRRRIANALSSDVSPHGPINACVEMLRLASNSSDDVGQRQTPSDADRVVAAHALSLLGNCALETKTKVALRACCEVANTTVPGIITPVLTCGVSALSERAAALLGNLCGDADIRGQLANDARAIKALVSLLPAPDAASKAGKATAAATAAGGGVAGLGGAALPAKKRDVAAVETTAAAAAPVGEVDDAATVTSALAALVNVIVEPAARASAAKAKAATRVLPLLGVASPPSIPARAAAALARLAREPTCAVAMLANDGAGGAAAVVAFARSILDGGGVKNLDAETSGALESAVRVLAVLASGASAEGRVAMCACAAGVLVRAVSADDASDGVVGNAALALADVAKEPSLLAKIAELKPVTPLLAACHRRAGAAQKNAAIACARLAIHPPMLEILKENNGLELIYRYVKP